MQSILLLLSFFTSISIFGMGDKAGFSFLGTFGNPSFSLPSLTQNTATSSPSISQKVLRLSLDAINQEALIPDSSLQELIIVRSQNTDLGLTQEQIELLADYYPAITTLYLDGLDMTVEATKALAGQFSQIEYVVTAKAGQTTEEILRKAAQQKSFLNFCI